MDTSDLEPAAVATWDPELTERLMGLIRPVIKGWHRAEVRGLVMQQGLDDLAAQRRFPVIG
jgi:hypothetical protein